MKELSSILIINSKNHWRNGWLTSPSHIQMASNIIEKTGIKVQSIEVENVAQLETVLNNTAENTLIWGNAYYVNHGDSIVWLNDFIENRNLPFIGSSAKTLRCLLQKDACQSILQEADLPIPKHCVLTKSTIGQLEERIKQSNINFPMVLKPTAESGSVGIVLVKNTSDLVTNAHQIINDFPQSNLIIEEFLPSDDITCGFLKLGQEVLLLPTYYLVRSVSGKSNILDRVQRLRKWDDIDKMQPVVTDSNILTQLEQSIPKIVKSLDIQTITRVDGRLNSIGELSFFDVNGLPALDFPDSVIIKQCFSCFPKYSTETVYQALLFTIVQNTLLKYDYAIPEMMRKHNLFELESEFVSRIGVYTASSS